jgi:uncharacterized protein (DUF305 family)
MQKNKKIMIGAGALVALVAVAGFCAAHSARFGHYQGMMGWDRFDKDDGRDSKRGNDGRNDGMMGDNSMGGMHNMQNGGQMMNNELSERQFLQEMIPHHQEAIDTAKQVVTKGDNAEVKKLAQSIVDSQQKQIDDMKTWYKNWYGVDYKDDGTYKPMMRTSLSTLSGNALDRAFLEDMIAHHMGALMMGQAVVPNLQHKEVEDLAKAIAESQSSEIITMRILLKQI